MLLMKNKTIITIMNKKHIIGILIFIQGLYVFATAQEADILTYIGK